MIMEHNGNEKANHKQIIDNANEKLKDLCVTTATHIYGEGIPEIVLHRLEKELNVINHNGYASIYLVASELASYSVREGYPVTCRGTLASSLVTYLCGISEVNPLPTHFYCPKCHHFEIVCEPDDRYGVCGYDLAPKICPRCETMMTSDGADISPEINMGIHLDKEPEVFLNFAPQIRDAVVEYVKDRYNNEHIFRAGIKVQQDGEIVNQGIHPGAIYIVSGDVDISQYTAFHIQSDDNWNLPVSEKDYHILDEHFKSYSLLLQPELGVIHDLARETGFPYRDIAFNDNDIVRAFTEWPNPFMNRFSKTYLEVISMLRPKTFSDMVKIEGLMCASGSWEDNVCDAIRGYSIDDIISSRDDVYRHMISKGLGREDAYAIMACIIRGKGLNDDCINMMREVGVTSDYIDRCNRIRYLYPLSQIIDYSMTNWRLAYYYIHYPNAYNDIYNKSQE